MNYRLIIIENSLKDKSILKNYTILSKTYFERGTPAESVMYKVEIPDNQVELISERLKNTLIPPYYCHLYQENPEEDTLIVIFKDTVFKARKSNYTEAFNYGVSHGVTKEQMRIEPTEVQKERW